MLNKLSQKVAANNLMKNQLYFQKSGVMKQASKSFASGP
jgi:hypothetical protein